MSAVCTSFLSFCTAGVYQWGLVEESFTSFPGPNSTRWPPCFMDEEGRRCHLRNRPRRLDGASLESRAMALGLLHHRRGGATI